MYRQEANYLLKINGLHSVNNRGLIVFAFEPRRQSTQVRVCHSCFCFTLNNKNTKIIDILEILIKCFSITSEIFVQVLSGLGVINTKPHGESAVSLKQLITLSL